MNTNFKFARLCSVTLCGMNSGWVVNEGDYYLKDEGVALLFAKGKGWASIQELHENHPDDFYYTEWEELDKEGWYESQHEDGRDAMYVEAN